MSGRTAIINVNVITGFAKIPDCGLFIESDGTIADIFNMRRYPSKSFPDDTMLLDCKGASLAPGLIDTHIHGIGGFGTEDLKEESILGMSERLADFGVTAFLPTVYTNELDKMISAEKAISRAMGKEKGARIMGINLEGPFISTERLGALNPAGVREVDVKTFDTLIDEGEGNVVCMTVAPELHGMRELALEARKKGVVLLAGHTDATYENIIEGMQCGILHSTHFFNAMSRLHHRNPGTVGAIMIQTDMQCEIIADGVHVHPELVKLLVREKPADNIVLITDSLKPTKQRGGKLMANGVEVKLSDEGAFVKAADPTLFEGSALTLIQAVANMVHWGIPIETAIRMGSTNPARIYRFDKLGMLMPGNKADICIFDENFQIQAVFIDGNLIRDRLS